ncbi:hypothetical protein BDV26DRAFT_172473 [Aspergillus bertholletiae]|uniref:Uncharacterized protein n=1 Tax=Aspergillus bertholletiae TaxID=1226010 RepID=A0A5N7BC22_9EURO|nr:hypothetical protein BDV26DRAFT_172473 [Aspergillus bertholletiae]
MNSIIKRIVSLFSIKEPRRDRSPPPAEPEQTLDQTPTMNHPELVSVVVFPPTFDLDPYESFDEEYFQRTVDEILSDQASFENSFDEYSGARMMDGSSERGASILKDSGVGGSGYLASPYFSSKVARKRPVAHRIIRKIESTDGEDEEDDDEDEEVLMSEEAERFYDGQHGSKVDRREDPADSVAKVKLEELEKVGLGDEVRLPEVEAEPAARAPSVIDVDAYGGEGLEEVSEERFIFASVSEKEHDRLVKFLVAHPFMREGAYPVERSARRRFVSDVRREASVSGMDEGALGVLIKWIKKTYLEVCMVADADKEGSEFGDEIDGENMVEHQSQREPKKERKRKRTSVDQEREKSKPKKTKRSKDLMTPSKHIMREVINIDSDDPAIAIPKSSCANIGAMKQSPVPRTDFQRTPISHRVNHENSQSGRAIIEHVTPKTPTTPSRQKRNERRTSNKKSSPLPPPTPRLNTSTPNNIIANSERSRRVSQAQTSRSDSAKKRTVSSAMDPPASHSKNPKSPSIIQKARKKEKQREKRQRRKERRKSERSVTTSEVSQPSQTEATCMANPVAHEYSVGSTSSVHKAVAPPSDTFWDMDF